MNKLFKMGIVSEKESNKPRDVLVKEYEELSDEALTTMLTNDITEEQIHEAFIVGQRG